MITQPLPDRLLTSADAGRLIDRTPGAIRAATMRGHLRAVLITSSGVHLYRPEDVLAYQSRVRRRRGRA